MLRVKMAAFAIAFPTVLCANVFASQVGPDTEAFFCATDTIAKGGVTFFQQVNSALLWTLDDGLPGSKDSKIIKIGVYFLDGNSIQREEVKRYAQEWITKSGAAIEWVFSDSVGSQIRITFKKRGSWSKVGKDALTVKDINEPTMSLAIENISSETRRQTILHEFGHALGMKHEHLHFKSGLKFNEEQIFKDLKDTPWCEDKNGKYIGEPDCKLQIKRQITMPLPESYACVGAPKYDKESIMMYSLSRDWTIPPGGTTASTVLSEGDWKCIRSYYANLPVTAGESSKPPYCEVTGSSVFVRSSPKVAHGNKIGHFLKRANIYATYIPKNTGWVRVRNYCLPRIGDWTPIKDRLGRPQTGYMSLRDKGRPILICTDMPPEKCGPF